MYNETYSIKEVYHEHVGVGQPIHWARFVWNRSSISKARFILWLAVNERLKSMDKLFALGIIPIDIFPLWGLHTESNTHMFFLCVLVFSVLETF